MGEGFLLPLPHLIRGNYHCSPPHEDPLAITYFAHLKVFYTSNIVVINGIFFIFKKTHRRVFPFFCVIILLRILNLVGKKEK